MALSWVEINLAALRHNFFEVKNRMSPGTCILGVVKSDAYGHGMIPVARELIVCGAQFFAVSKFWEARSLRSVGIPLPILTLLGVEPSDMEEAILQEIRPVVFRTDHARMLSETASRLGMPARIHIKVDTGMRRLGVPCEKVAPFLDELLNLPGVEIEGILSHFAGADETDKSYCECQLGRFCDTLKILEERGRPIRYAHISNSAGLLDLPHAHFHLVRPGIMLYGSPPSDELHKPANLQPVMSFKSRVLQLKELPAGEPIGYGRTYYTDKPSRIATIPVGYDDGYPRLLSNKGQVLVGGMRCPIVGRVSMNMITVDVTRVPNVKEDDEVVLLGKQGSEHISAEEIAQLCGTISYEIFCSVGKHPFKSFLNASSPEAIEKAMQSAKGSCGL
jgi:alanine racemase